MKTTTIHISSSLFILVFVGATLVCAPLICRADTGDSYADRLSRMRLSGQSLQWVGTTPPPESESKELWEIFGRSTKVIDLAQDFDAFLKVHTNSAWAPAVHAIMGEQCRQAGYFSDALKHWELAWTATGSASGARETQLANNVLMQWLQLLASLGRTDTMKSLFDETQGRPIPAALRQPFEQSRAAYGFMLMHPEKSYRCGTYALDAVAVALGRTNHIFDVLEQPSPESGFSLAFLEALARTNTLDLVAAKRPTGTELVVPSVVHWKESHYAAIIEKKGELYKVVDPTFRMAKWLTYAAIDSQCSGHFLVPAKQLPASWRALSINESENIRGKGYPAYFNPPFGPPCTDCSSCPPGSSGTGGSSGPPDGKCSTCNVNTPSISGPMTQSVGGSGGGSSSGNVHTEEALAHQHITMGMPTWTVTEPEINYWIQDEPLGYEPATGPRISFQMFYNSVGYERQIEQGASTLGTSVFGLGSAWGCSWLTYVDLSDFPSSVTAYPPGGGSRTYVDLTGFNVEFYTNTRMLESTNGSGDPTAFTVLYPSGAKDVYGFIPTNGSGSFMGQAYITQQVTAQGRTNAFIYDMPAYTNNGVILLDFVVDADGKTNTLHYITITNIDGANHVISQIDDPYGHTNTFAYDTNAALTNVVDVAGISSSFSYNGSGVLTNFTTPYGTTSFQVSHLLTNGAGPTTVVVTEPGNSHQMFAYVGEPGLGMPTPPKEYTDTNNVPVYRPGEDGFGYTKLGNPHWNDTNATDGMDFANSYYWGRLQFANLSAPFLASGVTNWDMTKLTTNDFNLGRLRHWNAAAIGNGQGNTLDMERLPSTDGVTLGKMIWYDYPGKPNSYTEGATAFPSLIEVVLPDGTDRYTLYLRDDSGNVTNEISTYSPDSTTNLLTRTNIYVYTNNRTDLSLIIGPDGVTNMAYGYSNHLVLTMTNAVGEVTSYTYNTNHQVTSVTYPTGLISTNIYDTNSRLTTNYSFALSGSVTNFGTNMYTYINGLVLTHTDERGLTVTNTWDALERLRRVDFPDATSITNTYTILDLTRVVDRMGFTNSYGYDSLRRLVAQTNAIGTVTRYGYCTCGALTSLTNALGTSVQAVTSYSYDNQGNPTNVAYADGYSVTKRYDSLRRVTNTIDSGGVSVTNWFNHQGLAYARSNYFGQVSKVLFDIKDRVTTNVDVNGVAISMTYDNLGRILTRTYPDTGKELFLYSVKGLVAYTNQLNEVTLYDYDAARRKITETNANLEVTAFTYDAAADLLTLTDGKTQTTTWNYDIYGMATNKVDNTGTEILRYKYDADQRLTNRWSAAKTNTYYYYDSVGNLTNVTYPVSPAITLSYDALNRVTNMVDAVGTSKYGYDPVGQLLNEDGPWNSDTVSLTYNNRLRSSLSVQEPNADPWTQSYAYDLARRLTNTTSPAGTFSYVYDATRQMLVGKLTLPNSAYITNSYDNNARELSTILKNSGNTTLNSHAYGYNAGNQRTALTNTAGDYRTYTYDPIGQLASATGTEAGGVTNRLQEQLSYGYDAAHNLNFRTNNALVQTFTVNSLNEISNITRNATNALTVAGTTSSAATNVTVNSFTAALYGDYTFASTNSFTLTNGNNSFTAIAKDSYGRQDTNTVTVNFPATNNYTYDANGNLLSDGTRGFDYDDENQLIRVTVTNKWKTEFTYDGKMRLRIRKDYTWWTSTIYIVTNEVHYIYDGNLVIQERDINNVPTTSYTRGPDLSGTRQGAGGIGGLLARTDQTQISPSHAYYHADGNGNVTALINALQVVVAKYLYDPFGNILSQSGPLADANVYRFSSKEFIVNAGLVYYLYRFYDPNLQRWLNRDPIEERGGFNLFTMVSNDPADSVDTNGKRGYGTGTGHVNDPPPIYVPPRIPPPPGTPPPKPPYNPGPTIPTGAGPWGPPVCPDGPGRCRTPDGRPGTLIPRYQLPPYNGDFSACVNANTSQLRDVTGAVIGGIIGIPGGGIGVSLGTGAGALVSPVAICTDWICVPNN